MKRELARRCKLRPQFESAILAQKPREGTFLLINLFSKRGQVVLNPFLGSGTTAIAAVRTGRSCIGIKIEADYIRMVEDRLKEVER